MSDTTLQECISCQIESDCIDGLCEPCSDYNYKLQKQANLLTLGLLQEKHKVTDLLEVCIKAHDALLSLHICNYDKSFASEIRSILKQAIAKAGK